MTGDRSAEATDLPPPGPAQQLVARAGFTVYEDGTNILNEPVLAYIGMSWRAHTEFKIYDHVDRVRGYAKHRGPAAAPGKTPCQIHDPWGSPLIQVRPSPARLGASYQVEGIVSGVFFSSPSDQREMVLMTHNEAIGYIIGRRSGGVAGRELSILDHHRNQVGAVKWFHDRSRILRQTASCAISVDPNLGGELRRLLIATPVVVAATRQSRRGTTMALPLALLVSR